MSDSGYPPPPPPSSGDNYGVSPAGGYQAAPPPGYGGQVPIDHPQGTTVLILGILSLVVCGFIGPFAWIKGNAALREIDASPGRYSNRGNVQIGRILGIIASVLLALGVIGFILVLIVSFATTPSS